MNEKRGFVWGGQMRTSIIVTAIDKKDEIKARVLQEVLNHKFNDMLDKWTRFFQTGKWPKE